MGKLITARARKNKRTARKDHSILLAADYNKSAGTLRTLFESSIVKLQKLARSQNHSWDPSLDLCQLVDNVHIV